MKAKFVSEGLNMLAPKTSDDIEEIFKNATLAQLQDLDYEVPDRQELQYMSTNIQYIYREMEADAPETDEEANEWGRKIQQAENEYEEAKKRRELLDKYIDEKRQIEYDVEQIEKDLTETGIDYKILDSYVDDGFSTIIDIELEGEEETLIVLSSTFVFLDDFDGKVELGRLEKFERWARKPDASFTEKLKEYLSLNPDEIKDFLYKYRH